MHLAYPSKSTQWNNILEFSSINLDDLLKRARHLDNNALGQIHDHYYPVVYRYVRFRMEDERVCEDITSEVFLRFLDALQKKRGPTQNLRGWLMGTASNLVNDHLRHRYRQPVENLEDSNIEALAGDDEPLESSWEGTWQKQQVRHALARLTDEQQHVLALRFAEELSLEETAKTIGKTITAVKALQFRALASLRRWLEERE